MHRFSLPTSHPPSPVRVLMPVCVRQSSYSVKEWELERSKTETYLANMSQDLTAGYLRQGPNGRSVFFDPSASLSPSRRLRPLSQQSSRRRRTRRGNKSKTWGRRSRTRGSSRYGVLYCAVLCAVRRVSVHPFLLEGRCPCVPRSV